MDINSLEKHELIDLVSMLGARLASSIEAELILEVRLNGLEGVQGEAERAGAWEERAQELSRELKNAKEQAEERRKSSQEILEQRDHAIGERDRLKTELANVRMASERQTIGHMEAEKKWKASEELFAANIRRLEREACADIARKAAITCDTAAQANILTNVVNDIKGRK